MARKTTLWTDSHSLQGFSTCRASGLRNDFRGFEDAIA
jgi:hypothetical protein